MEHAGIIAITGRREETVFVKIIVLGLIFAYLAIAVKLFNQLDRMVRNSDVDKPGAAILVILLSLFWPVLLFVKPGNNS